MAHRSSDLTPDLRSRLFRELGGPFAQATFFQHPQAARHERHLLNGPDAVIDFATWKTEAPLDVEDLDVSAAIRQAVADVASTAAERRVHFAVAETPATEGLPVHADRQLLNEILGELLGKAVQCAAPGERITVGPLAVGDAVWIRVEAGDHAPGSAFTMSLPRGRGMR